MSVWLYDCISVGDVYVDPINFSDRVLAINFSDRVLAIRRSALYLLSYSLTSLKELLSELANLFANLLAMDIHLFFDEI